MTKDELQSVVYNIESQSVQVSNCSFEMLRWIEDGPQSVKDLLRDYDLLKASFEANADETIALRKRFEDLWQVKQGLERDLDFERSTNNFDAKRLRRLATLCGCSVPESDETMLGCAGTVIGSITRVVEGLLGKSV